MWQEFWQKLGDCPQGCATIITRGTNGSVPERLMGADCKSAGYAYVGSNPTRPIHAIVKDVSLEKFYSLSPLILDFMPVWLSGRAHPW
jgi:hypothetical protein